MAKGRRVHRVEFGLKRLPHQEKPHDVEAEPLDAREVVGDLAEIEALPHVHRALARPIVDSQKKPRHVTEGVRGAARSASAWRKRAKPRSSGSSWAAVQIGRRC